MTNDTVGAGMLHFALRRVDNVHWQAVDVDKAARAGAQGPAARASSGSPACRAPASRRSPTWSSSKLHALGRHTYLLDGDNVRHGLNKDLGFTDADRVENIRRVAEVAKLMVDAGLIVLVVVHLAVPRRAPHGARRCSSDGEFLEVFVDTPLAVAEERDVKGLYAKARRGELANFTGIDSPYEPPEHPEMRVDTSDALGRAGRRRGDRCARAQRRARQLDLATRRPCRGRAPPIAPARPRVRAAARGC